LINCASVMLIGVDSYPLATGVRSLATTKSIVRLESAFNSFTDKMSLKTLPSAGNQSPNRADILEAVSIWTKSIEESQAGLLYFGCHARTTEDGLILMPSDFRESIPYDSGIPLSRLIELIARSRKAQTRFIVVLDCCRAGVNLEELAPPAWISILYACSSGYQAYETGHCSIFVAAFLAAFVNATHYRQNGRAYVRISDVVRSMVAEAMKGIVLPGSQSVLVGNVDDLILPAPISRKKRVKKRPLVQLFSRELPSRLHRLTIAGYRSVMEELCLAIPPPPKRDGLSSDEEHNHHVRIGLPVTASPILPSSILLRVISKCPAAFETVQIRWPRKVPKHLFVNFSVASGHSFIDIDNNTFVIDCREPSCRLSILIKCFPETHVEIRVFSIVDKVLLSLERSQNLPTVYEALLGF
jgi:hypothetical protein